MNIVLSVFTYQSLDLELDCTWYFVIVMQIVYELKKKTRVER